MKSFDTSHINKKEIKPVSPLIFQTAADLAAAWFEVALSSGLPRGKYVGRGDKPIKMFVADRLEMFIPIAISILIDMLKPTSNCNAAMRELIHKALTDPLNDTDLMLLGKKPNIKNEQEKLLQAAFSKFNKNKIISNALNILEYKPQKINLKSSTSLGG